MNVITQFTWEPDMAVTYVDPKEPSVTQPNMDYTIAQLLERHRNGLLTDVNREPIYFDDEDDFDAEDMEKLNQSDLVDKAAYVRSTRERKDASATEEGEGERTPRPQDAKDRKSEKGGVVTGGAGSTPSSESKASVSDAPL